MSDNIPQAIFINMDDKVRPAILAGMISRNVSLVYQWAQIGRFPDIKSENVTYRQALDHLITSLLSKTAGRTITKQRDPNIDEDFLAETEEGQTLIEAKIKQSIKTDRAREAEIWQKISIKRGEYVALGDKLNIVEPFVISIRDTLLHIGSLYPEVQNRLDEAMDELYQLGLKLIEEADIDADRYIDDMLKEELKEIE